VASTGRKSNHDFDVYVKKMAEQLVGALAAQDAGSGLAHLAKKLAQLRTTGGQPRATLSRRQRPRRPGWVVDAVAQVLADRREPMRATDIHVAVEALLGETVCWGSVKNALVNNISGPSRRFVRIARGRYVLV
jgi:predicted RecB family endonuclease